MKNDSLHVHRCYFCQDAYELSDRDIEKALDAELDISEVVYVCHPCFLEREDVINDLGRSGGLGGAGPVTPRCH